MCVWGGSGRGTTCALARALRIQAAHFLGILGLSGATIKEFWKKVFRPQPQVQCCLYLPHMYFISELLYLCIIDKCGKTAYCEGLPCPYRM